MTAMRSLTIGLALLAVMVPSAVFAKGGGGSRGGKGGMVNVRPHVRKDGTLVQPHPRTGPDASRWNNWSTKENVNPYTGKPGSKEP